MSGPATLEVAAASVSLAPDGGYHLLLVASAGAVRFHVPLAVGCSVFRITNPRSTEFVHKHIRTQASRPAPDLARGERLSAACADFINDASLGLSTAARRHGIKHPSALRERLVKTLGLARYQELSALRGHEPRFVGTGATT
ncbi:MAG TPA: hypothetical protein VHN79_11035 [Lacunisphaera sp.]|nr:hypothetical protein [Lacunisphaera sp.]